MKTAGRPERAGIVAAHEVPRLDLSQVRHGAGAVGRAAETGMGTPRVEAAAGGELPRGGHRPGNGAQRAAIGTGVPVNGLSMMAVLNRKLLTRMPNENKTIAV